MESGKQEPPPWAKALHACTPHPLHAGPPPLSTLQNLFSLPKGERLAWLPGAHRRGCLGSHQPRAGARFRRSLGRTVHMAQNLHPTDVLRPSKSPHLAAAAKTRMATAMGTRLCVPGLHPPQQARCSLKPPPPGSSQQEGRSGHQACAGDQVPKMMEKGPLEEPLLQTLWWGRGPVAAKAAESLPRASSGELTKAGPLQQIARLRLLTGARSAAKSASWPGCPKMPGGPLPRLPPPGTTRPPGTADPRTTTWWGTALWTQSPAI